MIQTVNFCDFTDAFEVFGRQDNFSYNGLKLLFDYLEQFEEDTGTPYELDVIALCCDYTEDTLDQINTNYDQHFDDLGQASDWLSEQTTIVGQTADTILYQQF